MKNTNCLIIAHRGESFDSPENTMAAINLAWERDADAVEIDVQLTKDNQVVVIHDTNTKRITGTNLNVKDSTLQELKKLDFGSYKGIKWKDERIPTLEEVLLTVPEGKRIIIEIKGEVEIIPAIKGKIKKLKLKNWQIEFIGFSLPVMAKLKNEMPEYKVLWIHELDYSWKGKIFCPSPVKLIEMALNNNLDGLDLWAGKKITEGLLEKVNDSDFLIYVWTVNDAEKAKKLVEMGVAGITTDHAQWLKSKLS